MLPSLENRDSTSIRAPLASGLHGFGTRGFGRHAAVAIATPVVATGNTAGPYPPSYRTPAVCRFHVKAVLGAESVAPSKLRTSMRFAAL